MYVSRRGFLKYCTASAAALGLAPHTLLALERLILSPSGPNVVWLEGLACSGCSVSFLNHLSASAPVDARDVLVNVINLTFHGTLMAASGESAVDAAYAARDSGNFILVVEGGVPTAFGGKPCIAWTRNGYEMTCRDVVTEFAAAAAKIVCVGQCSGFGGIAASGTNPAGIQSVKNVTGRTTINVAGCPPHPQWLVWTLAQLIAGVTIPVDSYGRPTQFFSATVHSQCPLRSAGEASNWGQESYCKEELGCRGPSTRGDCPNQYFNGGVNWCIGAGAQCMGCTTPTFPGTSAFYAWGD